MQSNNPKTILASRILGRLAATNQNPSSASEAAGLNRAAIRDIIDNSANPRIDTLRKLASQLQCTLDYLTGETDRTTGDTVAAASAVVGLTPQSVLAVAASQWQSIPTPEQIIKALAAGGFCVSRMSELNGELSETLRSLSEGKYSLEVGARIAAVRKAKGLTQEQFSEMLGCHWITVSKLENSKMDVSVEWLLRISDALKVDASELLGETMDGNGIRSTRERLGWSQDRLAQIAGTTQQTVDRIESGQTEHSRAKANVVAALRRGECGDASPVDDPVAFVREVISRRKISPNKLAALTGLVASTLTRALNNPNHKCVLSTRTIRKIKDWDRQQD
jgi:transcriptional regulator with XRE-family HTH domain